MTKVKTWECDSLLDSREKLDAVILAFNEYRTTEGCGCCELHEEHKKADDRLGALLGVPRYPDDSGVDWYTFVAEIRNRLSGTKD